MIHIQAIIVSSKKPSRPDAEVGIIELYSAKSAHVAQSVFLFLRKARALLCNSKVPPHGQWPGERPLYTCTEDPSEWYSGSYSVYIWILGW